MEGWGAVTSGGTNTKKTQAEMCLADRQGLRKISSIFSRPKTYLNDKDR
jgi:hypothetical protein